MPLTTSNEKVIPVTTDGTLLCPALDANGNPAKMAAYGGTPAAQPAAATNVHTVAAGATTAVYVNTTFDGSIGTTAYTIGDLVAALKTLNLIKN